MLLAQGRVQLFGSSFLRNLPKLWLFFCLASLPVGTTICGIWLDWAHIPYIVGGQGGEVSVSGLWGERRSGVWAMQYSGNV